MTPPPDDPELSDDEPVQGVVPQHSSTWPPSSVQGAVPRTSTPFSERLERSDFALPRPVRIKVREGETLVDVADEYGVSLTSLLRANPQVRDPERVFAGEELRLPAHGRQTLTPSPVASRAASISSPGFRPPTRSAEEEREARARATHDEARARAARDEARIRRRSSVSDDVEDGEPSLPSLEDVMAGNARFQVPHEGPAIRQLQARLNGAGFRVPETGRFGTTMRLAVKELQRQHGLTETGAVGAKTLEALSTSELHALRDGRLSLHAHDEGGAVRHVQRLLGLGLSNVVDATTEEAVRAFQAARGLPVTGVVDFRTLAALEGASAATLASGSPGHQAQAPRIDQHALGAAPPLVLSRAAAALMVRGQRSSTAMIDASTLASTLEALRAPPTSSHGSGELVAGFLTAAGIPSRFVARGTLDDVVGSLQQALAVPLLVQTFGGTVIALDQKSVRYPSLQLGDLYARRFADEHWVVVVGFRGAPNQPNAFVVNDGDNGATVEVSRREFERHALWPGGFRLVLQT
jgi:LysM repeat protein